MTALQIIVIAVIAAIITLYVGSILPRLREREAELRAQGRCVSCGAYVEDRSGDECSRCWLDRQA